MGQRCPLSCSGSAIPLDATALYNMVAFDNRRRKHQLILGDYPGPTRNQLVIALSSELPRQLLDRSFSISQRRPALSPSAPLTLPNTPPFGYFCRSLPIHPTSPSSRPSNPLKHFLKLQAALHPEMTDTTFYSPLNEQRHGLYLFVNLPATLEAGFTWYMLDSQKGIIGRPKSLFPPPFPLRSRNRIRVGSLSTIGFLHPTSQHCTHLATASPWPHRSLTTTRKSKSICNRGLSTLNRCYR